MKRFILIALALASATALLAPGDALAARGKKGKAGSFMRTYLQCDKAKERARKLDAGELICEDRVSLHFCPIYDGLPKDVQESLELEVYCNFIAGQRKGDPAGDAEIISTANAAGCFHGDETRAKLLDKYQGNAEVLDALQNFTKSLLENETQCLPKPAADTPKE